MAIDQEAYVTLVLSDNYLPGAAILAHSLRDAGTTKKLAVMVTLETLHPETISELKALYDYVLPVERIGNPYPANLFLIDRSDLLYAFTKINAWKLTQFRRVVFLDADVVVLRAPDELFDLPASFAAAPDIGWPDAFNTGVMALTPNMGTYWALNTLAKGGDSFDGADQGLLNQYYENKDWHRLSFTYNCTPNASYQYEPAYRYNKSKISTVHFIGAQKPWQRGRSASAQSGVYKELVNRWWAVYDRHYRVQSEEKGVNGFTSNLNTVRSYVKGESTGVEYESSSKGSDTLATTTEPSFTDPSDRTEAIVQGNVEPTSTIEQRRFSAAYNGWDATRAPPPAESKPEAANFPSVSYEMSADKHLFKPPIKYPEPPRDMWYKVPDDKPAPAWSRPKAIFPWEERQAARPSRVFAEDVASPPVETPSLASIDTQSKASSKDQQSPATPTISVTNHDLPKTFAPSTKNVWDEVSGIDTYVRQLSDVHRLRGKLQVLHGGPQESQSPVTEEPPPGAGKRRESLILTDFPSAVERPSLPVTPAPMRKAFWGQERDEMGQLPQAEGVPNQQDWDPTNRLEDLRRASLQMDPSTMIIPHKNVPKRDMPRSSIIPEDATSPGEHHVHFQEQQNPAAQRQPTVASSAVPSFGNVDFANSVSLESKEQILSPTEHSSSDLR